jgi:hypothetical protein
VQHVEDGGMKPQLAHWDGFKVYDLRNGVGEIRRFCLEDADRFFADGSDGDWREGGGASSKRSGRS